MALQKSVGLVQALGIDGQEVTVGQAVYAANNPLSDGTVKAGAFCFKGSASGDGEEFEYATATVSASMPVIGFVERVVDTAIADAKAEYQQTYPQGAPLTVAIRGQYYLKATESADDGDKVLVTIADGTIHFGSSAGAGQVDSGWTVKIPNGGASASSGDIVIVERF